MAEQITNPIVGIDRKKVIIAGVAVVIIGVLIKLVFRRLYCFYTFQFPPASALTLLFGVLLGAFGNLSKSLDEKFLKPAATSVAVAMLVVGLFMITAPFFTDLNRNFCVEDFDILVQLIQKEGQSVVNKDIDTIHEIYDPSAVVSRADTSESWQAYVYYSQKFATEEHCQVEHSEYLVQNFSRDLVHLTTASRGTYGPVGQGCTNVYGNPSGSDDWTFQKINGTWKIVSFEFNRK